MLEFLCKQIIVYNIMFYYECYISCYTGTVSFTKFGDQMNCLEQRKHSKIIMFGNSSSVAPHVEYGKVLLTDVFLSIKTFH